ncbi:MAG: tetratricopeptide repeat protein [Bacteroidetes bacterium]|nr:tetratricopeptide repeat protein [Bacteroidota bacterium]
MQSSEKYVKFFILILAALLSLASAVAQPATTPLQVAVQSAIANMDLDRPDQALENWNTAIELDPSKVEYKYERIICYVMKKDYAKALEQLTPIYKDTALFDRGYQLMGNIHDLLGDSSVSMRYYTEGLAAYPRSGRLHYEMGAAALIERRMDDAIAWWVKGTKAEPRFPTNYYWIAKVNADTKNKIWTLIYGEAFMNLERGSKRTKEISKMIFETWNAGLAFGDTVDPINLASDALLEAPGPAGPTSMSFPMAFEYMTAVTGQYLIPKEGTLKRLTMAQLVELQEKVTQAWVAKGYDTLYPNDILTWHKTLATSGYLREYLYWVISFGDYREMNAWFRVNEKKYDLFLHWFDTNSLPRDRAWRLGL